jgi:excisionase family DNA binding protein
MQLTAGQAAKAAGVSTATITRAIKRGRISASKDDGGSWRIDPAELHRTFPILASQADTEETLQSNVIPSKDRDLRLEVVRLEERLRSAEALKAAAEESREAAERDRDAWREQAERLTKALPAPTVTTPPPKRRQWWAWR